MRNAIAQRVKDGERMAGAFRIAFCTTCKQRANHLIKTLPQNIRDNANYDNCVFVVLDYNSKDGLAAFLNEFKSDKLVVYRFTEPTPFRMAHAKNLAHRLGIREGADILVNLDADNFSGPGFAEYLNEVFQEDRVYCWSRMIVGQGNRGISGRIAVTRNAFLTTGGYDERFETWGPDDKDFNRRLLEFGYAPKEIDRRFLKAIMHTDKVRFEAYPEVEEKAEEQEEEFASMPVNPIANIGRVGCGVVYRNSDKMPTEIGPVPTRVFGIGMHKTATCSLHSAFKLLGYDSAHWPSPRWAKDVWTEMIVHGHSPVLEQHYALCDLPISILYRELDRAYPGSKFVLSVRDEAEWLESVRRHWHPETNQFRASWERDKFSHQMHEIVYGRRSFDLDTMLARYRRHNAEVKGHFAVRKQDLLVADFTKDAGWHELCGFLREPLPDVPFPRENETKLARTP